MAHLVKNFKAFDSCLYCEIYKEPFSLKTNFFKVLYSPLWRNEFLMAQLNAYRFDNSSPPFIYSYHFERMQRSKIISSLSCWAEILFGVPQASILG